MQYFNPTFLLPMLPLMALCAVGIHASWKRGKLGERRGPILLTLALAVLLAVTVAFGFYSGAKVLTPLGLTLGAWIVLSSLIDPIDRLRRGLTLTRAVVGMTIAHIGVGVFVLSITMVESYTRERDIALAAGQSGTVGEYQYRFDGVAPIEGPNYDGLRGTVTISRDGKEITVLHPEKRQYWVQRSVMTEAGIKMQWSRNLFAALGEDLGAGRWSVRAQVRPWVNFVWFAAMIMALGGIVATTDRRYRRAAARDALASAGATSPIPAAGTADGDALPGRACAERLMSRFPRSAWGIRAAGDCVRCWHQARAGQSDHSVGVDRQACAGLSTAGTGWQWAHG